MAESRARMDSWMSRLGGQGDGVLRPTVSLTLGPPARNGHSPARNPTRHWSRPEPTTPMPLRKSHLYSSLWQSCDQLRGGMDASQYKDYVLTLLFMKYVSDKYAGRRRFRRNHGAAGREASPTWSTLKGDEGDRRRASTRSSARLADTNDFLLKGVVDQADFNDETKLGKGKEMQERLTKLVGIFEATRFSRQSRPWRRPPGRRLRIPHAALRDSVGQEQGTVLHPGGSITHHCPGDRDRPGHEAGPNGARSDLRFRVAPHQGRRPWVCDRVCPEIQQTLSAESPEGVARRMSVTTVLSDMGAEAAALRSPLDQSFRAQRGASGCPVRWESW